MQATKTVKVSSHALLGGSAFASITRPFTFRMCSCGGILDAHFFTQPVIRFDVISVSKNKPLHRTAHGPWHCFDGIALLRHFYWKTAAEEEEKFLLTWMLLTGDSRMVWLWGWYHNNPWHNIQTSIVSQTGQFNCAFIFFFLFDVIFNIQLLAMWRHQWKTKFPNKHTTLVHTSFFFFIFSLQSSIGFSIIPQKKVINA